MRSARVAGWVLCGALAALAAVYLVPGESDPAIRGYQRVGQFRELAFVGVLLLLVAQTLRAGGSSAHARLVPAPGPRRLSDWWALQIWGPLLLENLLYGLWLLLVQAFIWRYQGPALPWLGWLYLSSLLLTVAGAYAGLLGLGFFPLALWAVLAIVMPGPVAAGLVGLVFYALARPLQEPPPGRPSGGGLWALALLPLALSPLGTYMLLGGRPEAPQVALVAVCALVLSAVLAFEYPRPRLGPVSTLGVLLALGVFELILVPNFVRARPTGGLTACKSNLKNIATALEIYSTDFKGLYPLDSARLTPNYLKTIPTCPSAGRPTYLFEMASEPDRYTVVCVGRHHEGAGLNVANYPQYNSENGLTERP